MLRRFTPTLFNHMTTRTICLKQCGPANNDLTANAKLENLKHLTATDAAKQLHRLLMTSDEFKHLMFHRIFKVSQDELTHYLITRNKPSLHAIIQQTEDFDALLEKFPKQQQGLLARALCKNMKDFQTLLMPLSSKCQRQVLEFVGLQRIFKMCNKEPLGSIESDELNFFVINSSFNEVLRRKNRGYLHAMRVREDIRASHKVEL